MEVKLHPALTRALNSIKLLVSGFELLNFDETVFSTMRLPRKLRGWTLKLQCGHLDNHRFVSAINGNLSPECTSLSCCCMTCRLWGVRSDSISVFVLRVNTVIRLPGPLFGTGLTKPGIISIKRSKRSRKKTEQGKEERGKRLLSGPRVFIPGNECHGVTNPAREGDLKSVPQTPPPPSLLYCCCCYSTCSGVSLIS
jgi:hypothetical protein